MKSNFPSLSPDVSYIYNKIALKIILTYPSREGACLNNNVMPTTFHLGAGLLGYLHGGATDNCFKQYMSSSRCDKSMSLLGKLLLVAPPAALERIAWAWFHSRRLKSVAVLGWHWLIPDIQRLYVNLRTSRLSRPWYADVLKISICVDLREDVFRLFP